MESCHDSTKLKLLSVLFIFFVYVKYAIVKQVILVLYGRPCMRREQADHTLYLGLVFYAMKRSIVYEGGIYCST